MRCKPGDLAVFVHAPRDKAYLLGLFVTVLYAPGIGDTRLPDGVLAASNHPDNWVIEFQRPMEVPMMEFGVLSSRMASYAVAPDWALRPIRPDPTPETVTDDIEVSA